MVFEGSTPLPLGPGLATASALDCSVAGRGKSTEYLVELRAGGVAVSRRPAASPWEVAA